VRRVNPLPTLLTLCNLICGFWSITMSMRAARFIAQLEVLGGRSTELVQSLNADVARQHAYAVIFVFAAMVFDVLDGRVARKAGLSSRFGAELDSLSDIVSFGIAPAVLAKTVVDLGGWSPPAARLMWGMLALYVAAAAVRLARYNVEAVSPTDGHVGEKGKNYFVGLPSPAAAGMAVSPVLLYHWMGEQGRGEVFDPDVARWITLGLPVLLLLLGWLMISRVRYMHLGNRLFAGRQKLWPVMLLVVVAVFMVGIPQLAGSVLFGGYVVGFLGWDMLRRARSARARRLLRAAARRAAPGEEAPGAAKEGS
jgi:CDP-diacylglycerol--serine O-phosphatidyltransferase